MAASSYGIEPIGTIRSALTDPAQAPLQGDEGGPEAWLEIKTAVAPGLAGLQAGDDLIVLTWLHLAQRDVLQVHPRGRAEAPLRGVFTTRSQDRPNPIGLHRVTVVEIAGERIKIDSIEAIDGTPIIDIKPVLKRDRDS